MKRYIGDRTIDGVKVTVDGAPLDPCTDVKEFTKNGFEWSYEGPEPRQLALAAGKLRAAARQILPQFWKHYVGLLDTGSRRTARRARPGREFDIFGHREIGIDLRLLRREADAALRDLPGRQSRQFCAIEGDVARQRAPIAHDAAKSRRLAGSVAADQADEFAGGDREADAVEDAAALDVDFQVRYVQHQGALLRACGRAPTTAEIIAGSAKKASGGMSASTVP